MFCPLLVGAAVLPFGSDDGAPNERGYEYIIGELGGAGRVQSTGRLRPTCGRRHAARSSASSAAAAAFASFERRTWRNGRRALTVTPISTLSDSTQSNRDERNPPSGTRC